MKINTKSMVSITEANQNFSKVARLVDEVGSAVILKNNTPRPKQNKPFQMKTLWIFRKD